MRIRRCFGHAAGGVALVRASASGSNGHREMAVVVVHGGFDGFFVFVNHGVATTGHECGADVAAAFGAVVEVIGAAVAIAEQGVGQIHAAGLLQGL